MLIWVFLSLLSAPPLYCLEFKDAQGRMDLIPSHLVDVFYETELGQDLKKDVERGLLIDFSGTGRHSLKGAYINQLLEYARNIESLTNKQIAHDEIYLLDTANYLGCKQELVLYHLANRVWGYLRSQNQPKDMQLSEPDESYVRKIAKPYLNSPERFLQVNKKYFFPHRKNSFTCFDFSFKTLQEKYDQHYPFALSHGLADLIHRFCNSAYTGTNLEHNIEVDLSGHAIKTLILDDWIPKESDKDSKQSKKITLHLNISHNNVERIVWSRIYSHLVYEKLNLGRNPVTLIDESIYSLIHSYRSRGLYSQFLIPHHKLSVQEAALAAQKWYLASNTLLDRYSHGYNPDVVPVMIACLIMSGSATYDRFFDMKGLALLEGIIGGVVVWFAIHFCYLTRLAHAIAIQTHPDIEKPRANFHRPLANTWLEDRQKPQLILKQENDAS